MSMVWSREKPNMPDKIVHMDAGDDQQKRYVPNQKQPELTVE